jgi:hypothetical protein
MYFQQTRLVADGFVWPVFGCGMQWGSKQNSSRFIECDNYYGSGGRMTAPNLVWVLLLRESDLTPQCWSH